MITVYSAPLCMQCRITKIHLTKAGVPFTERNVREDKDAAKAIRDLGYEGIPVVTVQLDDGLDHWQGFKLDKLNAAIEVMS